VVALAEKILGLLELLGHLEGVGMLHHGVLDALNGRRLLHVSRPCPVNKKPLTTFTRMKGI
jgi:hypothetical protein